VSLAKSAVILGLFVWCAMCVTPGYSQLPQVKSDPLKPPQSLQGEAACSATEVSSCAEAASKILPLVMGPSPLEENLRRLTDEIGGRVTGSPEMAKAVAWGGWQ